MIGYNRKARLTMNLIQWTLLCFLLFYMQECGQTIHIVDVGGLLT